MFDKVFRKNWEKMVKLVHFLGDFRRPGHPVYKKLQAQIDQNLRNI